MSELQDGYNIVGLSQVTTTLMWSLHETATEFCLRDLIFTIYGLQYNY